METWIALIIVGLAVGLLARLLVPGPDPIGIILTCLLGIAGSIGGPYVAEMLGADASSQPARFLLSVAGAFVILLFSRLVPVPHDAV
jgi:uncharacterized membrane protein YeaQ/YmgE (transglycosylase-associated protein family)